MPLITVDSELDGRLERIVPPAYRGRRRCGVRVDFLLRQLLERSANGDCACRPASSCGSEPAPPCAAPDQTSQE